MSSSIKVALVAAALALWFAGPRTDVQAQSGPQIAGTYEGHVARRLINGDPRETRIYRLTMNSDLKTGIVIVYEVEGRKLRNEIGYVVVPKGNLTYEGETQPIKTTPGYIPDKIKLIFARDGKSVRWSHNDGKTEGSGTLMRVP